MCECDDSHVERAASDLWRYYDEHAAQARQHENLRATVTSILTGFAAVLVGFAATGGLQRSDIPAGALVVAIGLLGALLSLKHYERNRFHVQVLGVVRAHITELRNDTAQPPLSTSALRDRALEKHEDTFSLRPTKAKKGSWIARISLFQLWVVLDFVVAAVGVVIVVGSLT